MRTTSTCSPGPARGGTRSAPPTASRCCAFTDSSRTGPAPRSAAPAAAWSRSTSSCASAASRPTCSTAPRRRAAGAACDSKTRCCSRRMPASPARPPHSTSSSGASSPAAARCDGTRPRCASTRTPTVSPCTPPRERLRADTVVVTAGAWTEHSGGRHPSAPARRHRREPGALRPARPDRRVAVVQSLRRHTPGAVAVERLRDADARRGRQGRLPRRRRRGRSRCPAVPHRQARRACSPHTCANGCRGSTPTPPPRSAAPTPRRPTRRSCSTGSAVIVVGAGFSGQGFKFAPGVGAVLADLALDPAARAAEAFRLR